MSFKNKNVFYNFHLHLKNFVISCTNMDGINEKFLKPYDPKDVESRIYSKWEKGGFFKPEKNLAEQDNRPTFCITIAPPNITGNLHMGHALENTTSDILTRWHRMRGFETLWLPGTDHAGIATQNAVEKNLKKKGLTRHNLGKDKFLEEIWKWKDEYGNIILDQLKKIGCSLDWSRTRFTMDDDYQEAVKTAFLHYQEKGLIYQGERVINWCIKDQTALSDLEIEYTEEETSMWFIKYPLKGGGFIVVATTRPETMLGDTAVAVNPEDVRYKKLIGQEVVLPITERNISIIADDKVDKDFGTGAVKVTPAHSIIDSEIAERHNLTFLKIIDEFGKIIGVNNEFNGSKIKEVREKVLAKLTTAGLLVKEEKIAHNIGKCYRCGGIVEPILSKQWFIKMAPLAEKAISAIETKEVIYYPEKWGRVALDWLKNSRDWCISRQIWWGHKIPVPDSNDVFDTWFSSALWPFAALGWPKKTADFEKFYPTQTITSARDIIHIWISRMIFSGLEFTKQKPFNKVIIHATVLTKDGKRMSKSLGTGIDPLELIEKYGADALRFGLIYQAMGGQDIRFSEDHIAMGKKFCNKLWNISRFVLTKTGGKIRNNDIENLNISDNSQEKEILSKLEKCRENTEKSIERSDFGEAAHLLYDFVWKDFADKFIEYSKDNDSPETKETLAFCLANILKILHPFIPFITEEIWSLAQDDERMLIVEGWPKGKIKK